MSNISGISGMHSGVSSVALQSQISKLQGKYADCASCATTPSAEKQTQQSAIDNQIQSLKAELNKVSLDDSQVKIYKPTYSNQQVPNHSNSGQLINISV